MLGADPIVGPDNPLLNVSWLTPRIVAPTGSMYPATVLGAEKGTEWVLKTTTLSSPPTSAATRACLAMSLNVEVGSAHSPKLDPSKSILLAASSVAG